MFELIFKPLNYLAIIWKVEGHYSKKVFDFLIPLIISILISFLLVGIEFYFGSRTKEDVNIFASDISSLLAGFLQTIPGFYIAALAAIATLTSPTMDRDMDGVAPEYLGEPLNRREFLARLFSYLSFISLVAYFFILILRYMYNLEILATGQLTYSIVYFICLTIFNFLLVQLMLLTFLGLYYLGQRIHEN
ncbi:Uncharacterised protein [Acinetobacter junii]|uniref:hypothetical protein n=1 Tax=Acinetobacter junii TaxID=40215 RepID=UPI0002CEA9DA|nr:hypothetical protein [Acinetobacter junii]ENV67434.1 hypothetical protein F948_00958 [Acinetobacter junii CIP 64.5]SUU19769.1 Uncharacterised protein [Acinetobacter junii]SUU22283.1 Uncharacterised protein [Acinetobacter junii]